MATMFAKSYEVPVITSAVPTFQGMVYTVESADYIDTVVINGEHTSCTCGHSACSHIHTVNRRRTQEAAKSAARRVYSASFDLSYGYDY